MGEPGGRDPWPQDRLRARFDADGDGSVSGAERREVWQRRAERRAERAARLGLSAEYEAVARAQQRLQGARQGEDPEALAAARLHLQEVAEAFRAAWQRRRESTVR